MGGSLSEGRRRREPRLVFLHPSDVNAFRSARADVHHRLTVESRTAASADPPIKPLPSHYDGRSGRRLCQAAGRRRQSRSTGGDGDSQFADSLVNLISAADRER